jgi:proteic killer suppression protein
MANVILTQVLVTRAAEKQVCKIPRHIQEALRIWVETVERLGIRAARRISGYHDEPLKGVRRGQRSVRLNRAYRVIYVEVESGVLLMVIEVNKHGY